MQRPWIRDIASATNVVQSSYCQYQLISWNWHCLRCAFDVCNKTIIKVFAKQITLIFFWDILFIFRSQYAVHRDQRTSTCNKETSSRSWPCQPTPSLLGTRPVSAGTPSKIATKLIVSTPSLRRAEIRLWKICRRLAKQGRICRHTSARFQYRSDRPASGESWWYYGLDGDSLSARLCGSSDPYVGSWETFIGLVATGWFTSLVWSRYQCRF